MTIKSDDVPKKGPGRPKKENSETKVEEKVVEEKVEERVEEVSKDDTPRYGDKESSSTATEVKVEVKTEVTVPESEGKTLLKMERKNTSWATRSGVVFSRAHPFQLVNEDEAEELIEKVGGFKAATPEEVVAYYNDK